MKCKKCDVFTGSANRRITHITDGEFENDAQVSACKNPDKYLKLEIVSRIQEERSQKRIKDDTMQALYSLAICSNNSLLADTSTIFSTNQSLIVDFSKKKVETDKILVKCFLSAGVQLPVLRNKHFCEALTKISEFGSKYTPSSNETARTNIALSVENDVDEEVKIRLAGLSRTGGTICTDGWKEIGSEHLLNGVFVSTQRHHLKRTNLFKNN